MFYEGPVCPQGHPPISDPPEVGSLVSYDGGTYLVISKPDEAGEIGVFSVRAHRTIPINDAKPLRSP